MIVNKSFLTLEEDQKLEKIIRDITALKIYGAVKYDIKKFFEERENNKSKKLEQIITSRIMNLLMNAYDNREDQVQLDSYINQAMVLIWVLKGCE